VHSALTTVLLLVVLPGTLAAVGGARERVDSTRRATSTTSTASSRTQNDA
jgi:hypothetical protein